MTHHRVDYAGSLSGGAKVGELDPTSRGAAEVAAPWTYLRNLLTEDNDHAACNARPAAE